MYRNVKDYLFSYKSGKIYIVRGSMKDKIMTVKDFIYMFIAINYLEGNSEIDVFLLKKYLKEIFNNELSDSNFLFSFNILNEEIDRIISVIVKEELIIPIDDNNYCISIKDPKIILNLLQNDNRFSYFGIMTKIVNNYEKFVLNNDKINSFNSSFSIDDGLVKRKIK